jgi:hypothetical protein
MNKGYIVTPYIPKRQLNNGRIVWDMAKLPKMMLRIIQPTLIVKILAGLPFPQDKLSYKVIELYRKIYEIIKDT